MRPETIQKESGSNEQKFSFLKKDAVFNGTRSFSFLPVVAVVLLWSVGILHAQTSNEFFSTSMGSIPSGPTTSAQTARLLLNSDNPSGNTIGTTPVNVSVTATLSNQQYTGVNTGAGSPVVMFGATVNGGGTSAASVPVLRQMNAVGSPADTDFSNTPSGTAQGMDVTVNHAFSIFTSVNQWAGLSSPSTSDRIYMADLTLTFSSPVTNPLIQLTGAGGFSGSLGFSTELNLTTSGLSLTKVQGNTALTTTATQINNGVATGMASSCSTNVAACGTVRVNGSNITTVTFQVYIRGDGGATTWSTTTVHAGDQWLLGVSLPESYDISGNVYNDTDGSTTIDGTGIGSPSGTQLYANLVDPTDNSVLGPVAVDSGGTFTLTGVPGSVNYRVDLSTNQGTALATAPARALPSGWSYVGENLGAGAGNDGTPDGALNVSLMSANAANANFGITTGPTAARVGVKGRVWTADGRPGRRILVTIVGAATGDFQASFTNSFGYFKFENLEVGNFYIITATDKKSGLSDTQSFQIFEAREDLYFYLRPPGEGKTDLPAEEKVFSTNSKIRLK